MSRPWLWVVVITMLLIIQVVAASRHGTVVRSIVALQAIYWFVSYVFRPIAILVAQPVPQANDPVADFRLFRLGYESSLTGVLQTVAVGLSASAATLLALGWLRTRRTEIRSIRSDNETIFALAAICLGGQAFRFLSKYGTTFPAESVLLGVSTVAISYGVIFVRGLSTFTGAVLLAIGGVTELYWSVSSQSKTPIIALAVALVVRISAARLTRRTVALLAIVGAGMVLAFPTLQSLKLTEQATSRYQLVDSSYPQPFSVLGPVLRRFDLLSAVTDAKVLPPHSWLSMHEYFERAIMALVPNAVLGHNKALAGAQWAIEVRSQSLGGGSTGSGVSLAEGPIAEGFALIGVPGVILSSALIAVAAVATGTALLSRSLFIRVAAVALLSQSALFERGLVGLLEDTSQALQTAGIFCFVAALLHRRLRPRRDPVIEYKLAPSSSGTIEGK